MLVKCDATMNTFDTITSLRTNFIVVKGNCFMFLSNISYGLWITDRLSLIVFEFKVIRASSISHYSYTNDDITPICHLCPLSVAINLTP